MTWRVWDAEASPARLAMVSSRSIGNALRSGVSIAFLGAGEADARGLLVIAIFAFLAPAYPYF